MLSYQFIEYCEKVNQVLGEIKESLPLLFEYSINYKRHKEIICKTMLMSSTRIHNADGAYKTYPVNNSLISGFDFDYE